jgi:ABC-type sugar transport system permease subunit
VALARATRRELAWLGLAGPAAATLALLLAAPLVQALVIALRPQGIWGLGAFGQVFEDPLFRRALWLNLLVPVVSLAIEAGLGLALALWLWRLRRGRVLWRTLALLPFALPEIVFILTMQLLFRQHGYLNSLLVTLSGDPVLWLRPGSALATGVIIAIDVWRVTPIVFLLILVALDQIDRTLLEAVRLDGGGVWAEVRHVQIPLVMPMLVIAVALRAIDAFRIFATPYVLMGVQGFPVVTSYSYHLWADRGDPAAANAAALVLAVAIALVTVIGLTLLRRREAAA